MCTQSDLNVIAFNYFRPQEKKPEDSGRKSKAGVTIVRVGGSRGDVNSGVARGTEALGGSSSARFSSFQCVLTVSTIISLF